MTANPARLGNSLNALSIKQMHYIGKGSLDHELERIHEIAQR